MLKTMMLQEAKTVGYYQNNLSAILDGSLFEFKVIKNRNSEYIVSEIKNGDLFVFDDCNYIKFEMPTLQPVSLQKNTNIYNGFMRSRFNDFADFEVVYNCDSENIVNIVNFCDAYLQQYKRELHKKNANTNKRFKQMESSKISALTLENEVEY